MRFPLKPSRKFHYFKTQPPESELELRYKYNSNHASFLLIAYLFLCKLTFTILYQTELECIKDSFLSHHLRHQHELMILVLKLKPIRTKFKSMLDHGIKLLQANLCLSKCYVDRRIERCKCKNKCQKKICLKIWLVFVLSHVFIKEANSRTEDVLEM